MKRHYDQGNLQDENFNRGLANYFRELVHGNHGGECGIRPAHKNVTRAVAGILHQIYKQESKALDLKLKAHPQ